MKFYPWFLNSDVVPDSALRILLLLRYRIEMNPSLNEKKILSLARKDIGEKTGLSYNSVQNGLRELVTLNLLEIDPLKSGNKQVVRLIDDKEKFNWKLIQDRLGFNRK